RFPPLSGDGERRNPDVHLRGVGGRASALARSFRALRKEIMRNRVTQALSIVGQALASAAILAVANYSSKVAKGYRCLIGKHSGVFEDQFLAVAATEEVTFTTTRLSD